MSEVHRWEAVHLKDGASNIRYQDGTGPDMVKASDYDRLKAKLDYNNQVIDQRHAMLDTLRKQLDEARELVSVASEIIHEQAIHIDRPMTDLGSEALTRIDDWLAANPA